MAPDVACCDGIHFDLSDDHRRIVFSKIEDLRLSKVLCDVQLNVGSKQIPAHKLLLASSVPYFYSMFTHDLIESRQDVITLKDMDPVSIEAIINFVYTSKITINQKNVQALLRVASLLQVNLVQKKCSDFLEKQLDPSNCLGIYAFAEMHGCVHLKTKAKNYFDRNFCKVVKEDEYLNLPFERLRWFLDQNELCVRSEIEVSYVEKSDSKPFSMIHRQEIMSFYAVIIMIFHNFNNFYDFRMNLQHYRCSRKIFVTCA